MTLAAFAAEKRTEIFGELSLGHPPPYGTFDERLFAEGKDKGHPQIGATRYEPEAVVFEFIYVVPNATSILLPVTVASPEPIVYMRVPDWVVESVWQGDVSGSYRFNSEAEAMIEDFRAGLAFKHETTPIGRQ